MELDEKTARILEDHLDESRWYPDDPEYPGDPEINSETTWRLLHGYLDDKLNEAVGLSALSFRHDPVEPLEALTAARLIVDETRGAFWGLVYDARKRGDSWQAIADALGVTRQSAHAMYAKDLEERGEWWKGRIGADHFAKNLPEYQSVLTDEPETSDSTCAEDGCTAAVPDVDTNRCGGTQDGGPQGCGSPRCDAHLFPTATYGPLCAEDYEDTNPDAR